jgi:biopolymer transport protein ExbD
MPIGKHGRRRGAEEDTDINMVPIMNMFLVLIPFLLMSASFLHLKAINTSVPVQAERPTDPAENSDVKVTVVVQIQEGALRLSGLSDLLADEELRKLECTLRKAPDGGYPFAELATRLTQIKRAFPTSDTLLVIPDNAVIYETIIETMDVGRRSGEEALFPNVVLTGKVG